MATAEYVTKTKIIFTKSGSFGNIAFVQIDD